MKLCLCVHMACCHSGLHLVLDNNSLQSEQPHIEFVCENLHCRCVAVVDDDNKLVVVSEWQSMQMKMAFFHPNLKSVRNSQHHDCAQHVKMM